MESQKENYEELLLKEYEADEKAQILIPRLREIGMTDEQIYVLLREMW